MKKLFNLSLFCCILMPLFTLAQGNWVSFFQAIETKEFEGRRFRLEVAVRAEIEDDSASAHLWVRVDKEIGYGFFENMSLKPIRNKAWKTYTIEGTIDTGAYQLVFGALCMYNGTFYYDDVNLSIETEKNKWTIVFSDGFEAADLGNWKQSIKRYNTLFKTEIGRANAYSGKQCLSIEGKGVPNYGMNAKAGKYANVNGIRLYYEVYGAGQPLVVLHGNGGSIADATPHYPYFLGKNYQIIAIDSRLQGRSTDSEAELTYEQMASDVNELLNQLGKDSVFIYGHSDGAIVGLLIAIKYPAKVKKLVAFAANIVPDTTGIEPLIFRWIENESQNGKTEKERKLATLMWKHPNIPFSVLEKIGAEVLVMSGDRDFVPLMHTLQIFKHIPKSQLCIIPGATHGASWEKSELFRQLVTEFFEKPFSMPETTDWFKE